MERRSDTLRTKAVTLDFEVEVREFSDGYYEWLRRNMRLPNEHTLRDYFSQWFERFIRGLGGDVR